MSKDHSLLRAVSERFGEQTLREIVSKARLETGSAVDARDVRILSWDFGEASAKGDSYMSVVDRVSVEYEVGQTGAQQLRLIVKSLPNNLGRRKTFRSVDFFRNEIIFYEEIVPKFEAYLRTKGQPQLLNVPRCYACHRDGENDFIVLQDVSVAGWDYGPICRQTSLSYAQCKSSVVTLARFHAVSFGYKHKHPDDYAKMADALIETFYREDVYQNWYKRFHNTVLLRIAKDALAQERPDSEAERVFNSYEPGALVRRCAELCSRGHAATSVVGQGDAWAPNFLARARRGPSATDEQQLEVLLIDFQLARCASPVLDLSFFVYACTDGPMRERYYERLLADYYAELSESMKILGLDPEKVYPEQTFRKELKEQSVYGLTFALEALPFTMMPEEEAFDLDSMDPYAEADIADVWTVPNIRSKENRRREADMIAHAVENGFI